MKRLHAVGIAALIALAAVFGTIAATRTTTLGAAVRTTSAATFDARMHQLDRYAASLQKTLARKPPPLPALPTATSKPAQAAQRVVYRRPAPVVVVKHRAGGEHEDESEHDGGGGDD